VVRGQWPHPHLLATSLSAMLSLCGTRGSSSVVEHVQSPALRKKKENKKWTCHCNSHGHLRPLLVPMSFVSRGICASAGKCQLHPVSL
jgi:hypothetical protein